MLVKLRYSSYYGSMTLTAKTASDTDRDPPHPDPAEVTLQQILEALVDPVRRGIVAQLAAVEGEHVACGGFGLTVSNSTATHHFRVLREAGLIRQSYAGTWKMNVLRRAEVDQAFPGLLEALLGAERAGA